MGPADPEVVSLLRFGRPLLDALARADLPAAEAAASFPLPPEWDEQAGLWRLQREQLALDPRFAAWLPRAVLVAGRTVGYLSFAGPPAQGRVEIGYEILPAERRRGYGRAAVLALARELGAAGTARRLLARVDPGNEASLRLLAGCGFTPLAAAGAQRQFELALPVG